MTDDKVLNLTASDLLVMAPELALGIWFVLLILLDLFLPKSVSRTWVGGLTLTALIGAFILVLLRLMNMNGSDPVDTISILNDSYMVDDFASLLKLLFLAATALIVLVSMGSVGQDKAITDKGEYFYLLLPAVIGAMTMASSAHLMTLYIGLELLSISTYILTGLRKKSYLSAEAAFKYVVVGSIASAFILFGMSYLYGATGTLQLSAVDFATAISNRHFLAAVGLGFIIVGLAIKIAAAPFHVWAPDVYQGAPTPIVSFLTVVSKGAAVATIFRLLFYTSFPEFSQALMRMDYPFSYFADDFLFGLQLIAASSMLIGTLSALRQKNTKRLLALSGVANAGFLVVSLTVNFGIGAMSNISFYLLVYLLMTIGAFAVHTAVSRASGHDELKSYGGLYYRAPWTAVAMTIFILSLAGLPISAGFFGKAYILLNVVRSEEYWLAIVMVLSSVISYYFYFGIIRQMYMRIGAGGTAEIYKREAAGASEFESYKPFGEGFSERSAEDIGGYTEEADLEGGIGDPEGKVEMPLPIGIVVWSCALATLLLGLFPNLFIDFVYFVFETVEPIG
ncbi:NADH-quinone oxidoreductase subunit N [Paenibacillus sp. GCM10027627]|uniref:NADH-quinone oxidoreductase subunit N n=1 Tax=unclassified Paenibacillus TaxID=185978 RepID=UPI0036338411